MCYYIACHKSQNRLEPVRVEFGKREETRAVVVESCLVFLSSNSLLQEFLMAIHGVGRDIF